VIKFYFFSFLERAKANELKERTSPDIAVNTNPTINNRQLLILDESTLSRLVAARLDLPVSQNLLNKNFKLSIIKRSWEDQLRLKRKLRSSEFPFNTFNLIFIYPEDDFVSERDLMMACLILQKQMEHIAGKKENIVVPNIRMKEIHERREQARKFFR
jgi:hypothetical protein